MVRIGRLTLTVLVVVALSSCEDTEPRPAPAGTSSTSRTEPGGAPSTTTVTAPPRRTTADNRRAAARAAERVIRSVPLPPGTRRLRGEPEGYPDTYTVVNYNDPDAYQERWWTTALPRRDVLEFYVDHHPPGLRHTPGADPYSDGMGVGGLLGSTDFFPTPHDHWRQYSGPALVLDVATVGDRTVIHGYTQTSGRYARGPADRVSNPVNSIDVRRVLEDRHNRRHVQSRHFELPADRAAITRLVRTFNSLAGSTIAQSYGSCPIFETLSYVVWFHTGTGTLSVRTGSVYCGYPLRLARDRSTLRTTLTDYVRAARDGTDRAWTDILELLVRRR